MTRENKLALVIGFALILFVGVMVSDHFSAAANERAADFSNGRPNLIATRDAHFLELVPLGPERRAGQDQGTPTPQPTPPPSPDTSVAGVPNSSSGLPGFQPVPAPPEHPVDRFTLGSEPDRLNVQETVAFHDVQKGETLYAICKQHYGNASHIKALAKYNGINDPTSLSAGRRLKIPTEAILTGRAADATPSAATKSNPTATGQAAPPTSDPAASSHATYTVKASDTLTKIAKQVLGSPTRVQELIDLNGDVLNDPDDLRVGTKLKVPLLAMGSTR